MITYLNILIDLLLIFAVWQSFRFRVHWNLQHRSDVWGHVLAFKREYRERIKYELGKIEGRRTKMYISAKIAEKFAERAFTMASTANLGVIALQKTLQTPRFMHKEQSQRNQLAKNEIEELYNGTDSNGSHDYLSSVPEFLTKDEQQIFDIIEEQRMKEANKKH